MIKNVWKQHVSIEEGKWTTTLGIVLQTGEVMRVEIVDDMISNEQYIMSAEGGKKCEKKELLIQLQKSTFNYSAKETIQLLKNLEKTAFSKKNVEIKRSPLDDLLDALFVTEEKHQSKKYLVKINEMQLKLKMKEDKITELDYYQDGKDNILSSNFYVSIKDLFAFESKLETYIKNVTRIRRLVNENK